MPDPFTFRTATVSTPAHVVRFTGREAMNELYGFDVRLLIARHDVSAFLERALGERGTLSMNVDGDRGRVVYGILTEVDAVERYDDAHVIARARLAPKLARLTWRRTSRVFIARTTQEIVAEVLDRDRIRHRFALRGETPRREMCVQYDESDYEFVARLLAEEGLFTFFEHPAGGDEEIVVVGDEPSAYGAIEGGDQLRYRGGEPDSGMAQHEDIVRSFVGSRRLRPQAVLHRSYDFTRPQLELGVGHAVQGAPRLERRATMRALVDRDLTIAEHFGSREDGLVHPQGGRPRLEGERRGASEGTGTSASRRLIPGSVFKLTEHDVTELDGAYVVTDATHEGFGARFQEKSAPLYMNSFRCVPADVAVRPARPKRRVVEALETATVVGPAGQEVFTDAFARIKLKFHWDLDDAFDDKRSCWARVGQAWAGAGWGAQFIPRVGMEVLVGFMGGDPDRPVVLSAVYNGINPLPFANELAGGVSGIRSRRLEGGGTHEIVWDDRPGSEGLGLRADGLMTAVARDGMRLDAGSDTTIRTGVSRLDEVGQTFTMTVGADHRRRVGATETTDIAGDRVTQVKGESREVVAGVRDTTVGGASFERIAGGRTTFVGSTGPGSLGDTVAVQGPYRLSASTSIALLGREGLALRVGSSSIQLEPGRILIDADEIVVHGRKKLLAVQGEQQPAATLLLQGSASLAGGEVVAASGAGAKLRLDADAHLDGALVKLNCGSGPPPGAALETGSSEPESAVIKLDPRFLEGAGPYTLVVQMPDGTIEEHPVDAGGQVVLNGPAGATFQIVELRLGTEGVAIRREDT